MKKILFALACLLVVVSLPASALAGNVTLFERVYIKPAGKPETYTNSFNLGPNTGNYQLIVTNGIDGSSEVQNVFIWVNGVQVYGQRGNSRNAIVSEVKLEAENTITVALQGKGSTFITVEVVGEQTTPPPRFI